MYFRMESGQFWRLATLSDAQIRHGLSELVASGYRTEARIIAHLAELEGRKLHLKAGSESLFHYCTHVLRLSNSEAFHRITAARIARRYPIVFSLIEQRQLHLTAICLLRDYLTSENHHELLTEVCHKTKLQIEDLLARRFPRPDVESRVRKLPARRRPSVPAACVDSNTLTLPPVNPVSEPAHERAWLNRPQHSLPQHLHPDHNAHTQLAPDCQAHTQLAPDCQAHTQLAPEHDAHTQLAVPD